MEMGMDEGEGRASAPYTAERRSSSARCEADVKRAARVRASGARRVTETRGVRAGAGEGGAEVAARGGGLSARRGERGAGRG